MLPLNVVILAAGKGKRMHSALPKVLHRIGGRPLLQHVIDAARAAEAARIVVVYGHGGEQVKAAIDDTALAWALQEPQLGTGHAVRQAMPLLAADSVTLVLYGDVPLIRPSTLRRVVGIAQKRHLALLSMELEDPFGYGRILRTTDGRIAAIVEEKDATAAQRRIREVNTGILAAPTGLLDGWLSRLNNDNVQGEYYLTDVVALAVADGVPVEAAAPDQTWEPLGVNDKTQLAQLERRYQREYAQRLLDHGVTLADPARIEVRGTLECGRDVFIDVGCVFEGHVQLGHDVQVGPYCVLKDAAVGAGTHIAPYTVIDGAQLGRSCVIGPFARLRPGTELDEDVHIGNFVEVKNSRVGRSSKANHLSYLGDSSVGRDVNIGAGTITCNYDGASKHRTVIEDEVFIGSDTQLVAPVTVGKGATVGAGTTVTEDVPPGELALSRVRQTTVSGWKRPVKPGRKKPA